MGIASQLNGKAVVMESEGNLNQVERLESLKTGVLGGLTALSMQGLIGLGHGFIEHWSGLPALDALLVSATIAALSGFLFAVTYRYVIRQDNNSHLRQGAVLAFSLVRGLPEVERQWQGGTAIAFLALPVLDSILLFTGVTLALNSALAHGLIRPFGTAGQ